MTTEKLFLSRVDRMVAEFPEDVLRQIIKDYSDLEQMGQAGVSGDTVLREKAIEIYRSIHLLEDGFDGDYLFYVGVAAHKVGSIRALEAETSDLARKQEMALAFVESIARGDDLTIEDVRAEAIALLGGVPAADANPDEDEDLEP